MKKQLTLRLIESNDSPKIGDIVRNNGEHTRLATKATIAFLKAGYSNPKLIKPIGISDEEIKVGDNYAIIGMSPEGIFNELPKGGLRKELYGKNIFKIEILPEHFSNDILQLIVDGVLTDNSEIEVEEEHYNGLFTRIKLDSNNKAIISIPEESIQQRVEKALQSQPTTVEEVVSKMYAKAHTKLEKRPSANDGNYNYIHQIDTINLIEETANEVSKIMYSEEEIKELLSKLINSHQLHRGIQIATLLPQWFEDNKK